MKAIDEIRAVLVAYAPSAEEYQEIRKVVDDEENRTLHTSHGNNGSRDYPDSGSHAHKDSAVSENTIEDLLEEPRLVWTTRRPSDPYLSAEAQGDRRA